MARSEHSSSGGRCTPQKFIKHVGGMYMLGGATASFYYFLKGMSNSANGVRLTGGAQSVRLNAPRAAGRLASYSALLHIFECTTCYLRQKEDPCNSIIAGAATAGFLSMRRGLGVASFSAVSCGLAFSVIDGAFLIMTSKLKKSEADDHASFNERDITHWQ